ncbi:MAG: cyclic nucleotide-binding domain-containing protein [Deltaproteobacteria bacterium]|nr:MAG: cyclic nucleotide-binding domain-containing protein [Deltaproteobacteria bacterium]
MAIPRDAIKYALTLLKQGRLRLPELCDVMAVYGARTLVGEIGAAPDAPSAEVIEGILTDVLRGEEVAEASSVADELGAYFEGIESWHDVEDDVSGPSTDLDGLQEDSTDLGGATGGPMHRRVIRDPTDIVVSRRARTQTRLARFFAEAGIEPTVSPGLDADGPALDGEGTSQYAIGPEIGKGGAGYVAHGVDRDLRRSVAVKVLHEKHRNNALLLRAFIEEAIITGGLEHPNIVPVYQLGFSEELGPYYVMKRLDGLTLGGALQGLRKHDPEMEARFDLDRLLTIFIEVCQAIVYAHDRRVVHCDLKPNNVLIGHYGEVMLVDWGLAYVMGEIGTLQARSQFWSGTPGFMAPEQVIGDVTAYDQRTDIWALGGLLYAMLCLARPFVGKTKQETLHMVLNEDPVPPSRRNPTRRVPETLERICLKAMSKAKEDRYQTVNELLAEVENHLAGRRRLRQRVELGQKALAEVRVELDRLYGTEAVVDALQTKLVEPGVSREKLGQWRRDLVDLREQLAMAYREAIRIGVEAIEAGAHHPALNALVGDLYWRVFRRLYPARVPANRQVQRLATEMLRQVGEAALLAVIQQGRRLAGMGDEAPPVPDGDHGGGDPWLDAVLAYCGPDATAPDADREGVAAELGRRLSFLKEVALFEEVAGMELLPIAAACEHRVYRANTPIFNQGDFGDSLYIIIDGFVNVVIDGTAVSTLGRASVLGEIAIIDGATRTASAVCASDVSVYRLSADQFRTIVRENGSIGLAVMRVLTGRLRQSSAREGALRSIHQRGPS